MSDIFEQSPKNRQVKHWTTDEETFLFKNWNVLSMPELCEKLGRNERSINLYLYRHRNDPRLLIKDNLLLRILRYQFVKPEYFTPDRDFYEAVKIGQKRFQAIYKGKKNMTDEECKRICSFFNIPLQVVRKVGQLSFLDKPITEQVTSNDEPGEDLNQLKIFKDNI